MGLIIWGGCALVIALLSWFIWDKRYRKYGLRNLPPGFEKTDEVFIDPVEGNRQRVYYNPATGERHYVEEQ